MPAPRSPRPISRFLIVAACLALSLAACSSSQDSSTAATYTVAPTATLSPFSPTATPGPFSGRSTFADPLTGGNVNQWDILANPGQTSCQLDRSGYHLTIAPSFGIACFTRLQTFGDFAFQVDMTFNQGNTYDHGGIVFRSNGVYYNLSGYELTVRPDGHFVLTQCVANNCSAELNNWNDRSFHSGLHVTNTLGVVARSGTLWVYVNGDPITNVTAEGFAPGYFSGYIGLLLTGNAQSEVTYTNAVAWRL
jgi:hypothetical protein